MKRYIYITSTPASRLFPFLAVVYWTLFTSNEGWTMCMYLNASCVERWCLLLLYKTYSSLCPFSMQTQCNFKGIRFLPLCTWDEQLFWFILVLMFSYMWWCTDTFSRWNCCCPVAEGMGAGGWTWPWTTAGPCDGTARACEWGPTCGAVLLCPCPCPLVLWGIAETFEEQIDILYNIDI